MLLPIEGYKVPVSETRVHVKDKVEYLAIDDISLLIKTEDEVDAEAEDSAVAGALADADKTEIQKLQTTSGNAKVGIDVSKWNKEIDWDKVENAGVQFAIIRAGYRGSVTGSLVDDKLELNFRRDERVIRFLTFKQDKYAAEYAAKRRSVKSTKKED